MIRMTWCPRAKQQSAASGRIRIGSRPSPRLPLCVTLLVFSVHTRAVAAQGEWCGVRRDETSRLRWLPKAETPSQSPIAAAREGGGAQCPFPRREGDPALCTSFSLAIQLPESRKHQISISTSLLGKYFCHGISLLRNRHTNLTCSSMLFKTHCDTVWGAKTREKSDDRRDRNPVCLRDPGSVQCCDPYSVAGVPFHREHRSTVPPFHTTPFPTSCRKP